MLNNEFLKRSDLSMKAKGLLAYFLSLPNNWKIVRKELPNNFKDNITAVNTAIKELEKSGYIIRYQKRNKQQRFEGIVYDIYETPQGLVDSMGEMLDGESQQTKKHLCFRDQVF